MVRKVAILALAAFAKATTVSEAPVISLDLEGMGDLTEAHANKEALCHTKAEWETLLLGGTPGFKIPGCLHDGSGVNLVKASRCQVQTEDVKSCPEPTVNAYDHHQGSLTSHITRAYTLCIESKSGVEQPIVTSREVDGIDRNQRGEFLITYGVQDSSGNFAEEVQFAMIFDDHEKPTFNKDKIVFPRTLESLKDWKTSVTLTPDLATKGQATDLYDKDVSHEIWFTKNTVDIQKLQTHTLEVNVRDYANIFGLKNKDNVATIKMGVTVHDRTKPEVICQEKVGKPVTCTTEGCENECPCGECTPLKIDCMKLDTGKFDVTSLGYCLDYHDSWDGTAPDIQKLRPSDVRIRGYNYHKDDKNVRVSSKGHFTDHHKDAWVVYTCTDSSTNQHSAVRKVERVDYVAPKITIGESPLEVQCGTGAARRAIDDLLTHFPKDGSTPSSKNIRHGDGYTVTDQCDEAVTCEISLFKGNCGGKFECRDRRGKWTTCNGGRHRPITTVKHELYTGDVLPQADFEKVYASFKDGLKLGTYALKYSCSDDHGNTGTKCRTIVNKESETCNPSCAPDEFQFKPKSWSELKRGMTKPVLVKTRPPSKLCSIRYDGDYCCPLTVCKTPVQYEFIKPMKFSDRKCPNCRVCTQWEFQTKDCTSGKFGNRVCKPHTNPPCKFPKEYEAKSPSGFWDRKCEKVTPCKRGFCEVAKPTPFTNRICKKCAPIDCVAGWSDDTICKISLGEMKRSKKRTYSKPKYGGKNCPMNEKYKSSVREKIVVSNGDMTKADADRINNSDKEKQHYVDVLMKKMGVGSGGILRPVGFVEAKYFDFDGDDGVDLIFDAFAEFEKAQHCQEMSMQVLLGTVMKTNTPPIFDGAADEALFTTIAGDFLANFLDKDPSEVVFLPNRQTGARTDRGSGRRLEEDDDKWAQEKIANKSASATTLNFAFHATLTATEGVKCQKKSVTQAKLNKFINEWSIYHPNDPPKDKFDQWLLTLKLLAIPPPAIDLGPPEDAVNNELQRSESSEVKCPVDCEVSNFANKTVCGTCGGGWVNAKRFITEKPMHGGDECPDLKVVTVCNADTVKNSPAARHICKRCQTRKCSPKCDPPLAWHPWNACSKTCGGGMQCRKVPTKHLHRMARGCPTSQCRSCNPFKCGPEVCENKPYIPLTTCVKNSPFCCDGEKVGKCYTASACVGRSDVGGVAGRFCQPEWYRHCRKLAAMNSPCLYESVLQSAFENRVCTPITVICDDPDKQLLVAPTATTNSYCAAPTVCTLDQYAVKKPILPLTDRTCAKLTVTCNRGKHPIKIDQEVCGPKAPFCTSKSEYISSPPTPTSDVKCKSLDLCSSEFCKSGAVTDASDRICVTLGFDYTSESDYLADEKTILTKIKAATEHFGGPVENVVTKTATLEPVRIPRTGSRQMHAHRLVVDLSIKVAGGTFEQMVLGKKNPSAVALAGIQSDAWHTTVCMSLRHDTKNFKKFKCDHLHVYTINCKQLRSPPALSIVGKSTIFSEVTNDPYSDQGSVCTDSVDGGIRVRPDGAKKVNLKVEGKYKVTYTCTNSAGMSTTKEREIIVHHTTCPACVLKGDEVETVEASFPFVDTASVVCSSLFKVTQSVIGTVDVEKTGNYTLTYVATDSEGLKSSDCHPAMTRTVIVDDTLKPVIRLDYKKAAFFGKTPTNTFTEVSQTTGRNNPAYEASGANVSFMEETNGQRWTLAGVMAAGAIAAVAMFAASRPPPPLATRTPAGPPLKSRRYSV